MFLSKDALSEFQSLYLNEFQVKITEAEALKYGARLICLVEAVCGTDPDQLKAIDRKYGKKNN